MSPSSTVHGQYDTKYVTFEELLHVAFVADTVWSDELESGRISILGGLRFTKLCWVGNPVKKIL